MHNALQDPVIVEIATRHSKSPAQVVLRWHLEHRTAVVPKSVRRERIAENFDIFDFSLMPDEVAAIDGLDTGVRAGPEPATVDAMRTAFRIPD